MNVFFYPARVRDKNYLQNVISSNAVYEAVFKGIINNLFSTKIALWNNAVTIWWKMFFSDHLKVLKILV